jgi:membrane protein implicated in regulation of membrane protease activity
MIDVFLENLPLLFLAVGLIMMALEALSPGAHLIVIGVALVGAGLIGLLIPPLAGPLFLAGLTLAFGVAAAYVYREFDFYGGKGTARTKDSDSLAGATGYVTEEVTQRGGQVKLDGGGFSPHYSARSTDDTIAEGEEIIVLDPGGGNVLTVAALGAIEDDEIDRALARGADADADAADESEGRSADSQTESELLRDTERSG